MINVGSNYGKSINCPLGCPSQDTQEHIFQCEYLKDNDNPQNNSTNYKDIFSDMPLKFMTITDIAQKRLRKREELLENK